MPGTNEELDAAVGKFWQDLPRGGMAAKWFMVVEGMDSDGSRWLDFVWSDDLKTWDVRGMLHEALDSQFAGALADEVREED
jgi:hypothetical protein